MLPFEQVPERYRHLFEIPTDSVEVVQRRLGLQAGCLKGRVVLITGGARGLGAQAAIGMAHLGAQVVIGDKRESGREVARIIGEAGFEASFLKCELSQVAEVRRLCAHAEQVFGRVDILVNNAVHFVVQDTLSLPVEEWELAHQVNSRVALVAAQCLVPGMLRAGSGVVANLLALEGMGYAAAMSASKVGLRSLMLSLTEELSSDSGVFQVGFAPGLAATPLVAEVFVPYAERLGLTLEDYVTSVVDNPGYPGLVPAEHASAALVCTIVEAEQYHGLIASPFHMLADAGLVEKQGAAKGQQDRRINQYIGEVTKLNDNIERRVNRKTAEIRSDKERAEQLLEIVSQQKVALDAKARVLEESNAKLALAEQAAQAANRTKSAFLATMTHELRTPMNGVIGIADLLSDSPLNSDQQELVETLRRSGQTLLALINDILDHSKIEAGEMQLSPQAISPASLAQEVSRLLQVKADEKNILLQMDLQQLPQAVTLDPLRLQQVALNLLGNAIKFTSEGGVSVRWKHAAGRLTIEVEDTGVGIAENAVAHIFEAFAQAETSTAQAFGGTGLGLAISRRLVKLMGGELSVTSRLGVGSCFKVCVPAPLATLESQHETTADRRVFSGSVLLVDDNKVNRLVGRRLLEKLGFRVSVAEDGQQACDAVKQHCYEMVFMDCQMPVLDGYAASRKIRNELELTVPIIAMTASTAAGERERCIAAGMSDYISKPVTLQSLRDLLRGSLVT